MNEAEKLDRIYSLIEKVSISNTEVEKKVDNVMIHIQSLEEDVKGLAVDVKSLNSKFADISREVGKLETEIKHGKEERTEVRQEIQRIWNFFTINKENIKIDLKEYINTVTSGEMAKIKNWTLESRNKMTASFIAAGVSAVGAIAAALMRK